MKPWKILDVTKGEWKEKLDDIREVMGTSPSSTTERKDEIVEGVKDIRVELIDWTENPYEAIYEMTVATWGNRKNWMRKWDDTPQEGRLAVVLACLNHDTLPAPLEAPQFTFAIQGPSRAAFDQIARQRIGVSIGSVGTRDNDWKDARLRIPNSIAEDEELKKDFEEVFKRIKDVYQKVGEKGLSWQAARSILPMGTCHRWTSRYNYSALQSFCTRRLQFCEQEDTVTSAWKIREEVKKKFPLLAAFLRPGCDLAGHCTYHESYSLSEAFGCLFTSCGRHGKDEDYGYATFNESCSDAETIAEQTGIEIPESNEWDGITKDAVSEEIRRGNF